MRRVLLALVSTVTGLVMLLSFKTSAVVAPSAAAATASPTTVAGTSTSTGTASSGTVTVTGAAADTRYGPVQVKITVTNGKVTSAVAVEYPNGNGRDQEINASAVPVLEQETVKASSATIDMVSGATYTSEGFITSLQSALNKV